jgi:hypothetical protein
MTEGDPWRHLERVFFDLYKKEIDQEENVWRSLPFFAATLGLEVAVLNGAVGAAPSMPLPWLAAFAIGVVLLAGSILLVLLHLFRSIRRQEYQYLPAEQEILDWVRSFGVHPLDPPDPDPSAAPAAEPEPPPPAEEDATAGWAARVYGPGEVDRRLRQLLVEQLAVATQHNRGLNQRRAASRTTAGALLIGSVLATLLVVGIVAGYHVATDERLRSLLDGSASVEGAERPGPAEPDTGTSAGSPPSGDSAGAAQDAGRDQGPVGLQGGAGPGRGAPPPQP